MYIKIITLLKDYQRGIALGFGYLLVAGMSFGLGEALAGRPTAPDIRVEQAFLPPNDTAIAGANQSGANGPTGPNPAPGPVPPPAGATDCAPGQIKGNVGSGGSRVYHMPGGSFYNRTKAEQCFATEAEAQAAGFRKSNA